MLLNPDRNQLYFHKSHYFNLMSSEYNICNLQCRRR